MDEMKSEIENLLAETKDARSALVAERDELQKEIDVKTGQINVLLHLKNCASKFPIEPERGTDTL